MNKAKSISRILAVLLATSFLATGCGTDAPPASQASGSAASSQTNGETPAYITDMLAPYDEPTTITVVRSIGPTLTFAEGDDISNNIWTKGYLDDLNIKIEYKWTVPTEQFDQKLNLAIASQDLPDIVIGDKQKQLLDMVENDLVLDLTDAYDKYTPDGIKDFYKSIETEFNTAKVNDRLMSIPVGGSSVDTVGMIWMRQDWLDNLKLEVPKTMDELVEVARAFTYDDPDGNGTDDTIGFSFSKYTATGSSINSLMYAFGAYPTAWIEKNGAIEYGSIQPEVKTALSALQKIYADGLIDKEFNTKDVTQQNEMIAAGKAGIIYGGMADPLGSMWSTVRNIEGADWTPVNYVSATNEPAKAITNININNYYMLNKNTQHPEALFKMMAFAYDIYYEGNVEEQALYGGKDTGHFVEGYSVIKMSDPMQNQKQYEHITAYVDGGDESVLKSDLERNNAKEALSYLNDKNLNGWATAKIVYGPKSSFGVIGNYRDKGNVIYNAFYGALTDSMQTKKTTLDSLEFEVFTKIIMGDDINTFDKFTNDWKNMGGNDMTKEVQEWAATK